MTEIKIVRNELGREITKDDIEQLVGISIVDIRYYVEAFAYNSPSSQRLEFLGDSILNLVITRFLFETFRDKNEGFLTKLRIKFVSGDFLSQIARKVGIQRYVLMTEASIEKNRNSNKRILEDTFEALIGAIYIDLGLNAAKYFILNTLQRSVNVSEMIIDTNYKDRLIKFAHSENMPRPDFCTTFERGGCNSHFIVNILMDGRKVSDGIGTTRKDAEQDASKKALLLFGISNEVIT